ncbi:hypothetical protein QTI33_26085 [Variovorax sp. J22P271]|uniref:hypothetical protein n=1 Tax=Variovorax davisae TaxID=3053515 RepID=UPI002578D82F|nr:hypothetical protein [Variovorax sp. J22P271]MDM0035630.1 hypothetical protein [Variovorax sp. J22P271]
MGYLDRLAARLVAPRPLIRPRPSSRFEAADPFTAPLPEPGMAAEDDALPAPAMRTRPTQAVQDRDDDSRPFAPSMPPERASASPLEQRRTSVIHESSGLPPIQDGSTPVLQDLRTTPREGPAPATAERLAPEPALAAAMPSFQAASPPPDAVRVPSPARPVAAAQHRMAGVDMAGRIAPWRAPTEEAGRPAIDTRTPGPASIAATAPRQRETTAATAADPSAVVQVTIGRLEVRSPDGQTRRPSAKPARAAPRMSLQDYLQRRAGGPGR